MKFNRYALSLLIVPVLLFTAKSYAQNTVEDNFVQPNKPIRLFSVEVINQDGSTISVSGSSRKSKLPEIVQDLDVVYYPEDKLTVFPDLYMEMGGKITLRRAPTMNIKDGKKKTLYRSWAGTVGELLAEKNIELGKDDKILPDVETQIYEGSTIKINRVAKTTVVESQTTDFKIIKKDDPTLDKGKQRVQTAGKKGSLALTYEVTRQDGEEVSRRLIGTEVSLAPVDEILIIGTKPVITVRCKFNDTVLAAAAKYKQDPDAICNLMMKESNGNANSVGNHNGVNYYGLFQYQDGSWDGSAAKAGFAGAAWTDSTAQIYTTAYYFSIGRANRW